MAKVVRSHRKAAKLTQHELAELAGVGKTLVFDIEKGKDTIKLYSLLKVLNALNIDLILTSPLMNENRMR